MVWSNIAPKVEKSYLYHETPKKSFFQKLIFLLSINFFATKIPVFKAGYKMA